MDLKLLLKVILLSKTILRGNNFTKCSMCYHLVGICCIYHNQNSEFGIPKTRRLLLQQYKRVLQGLEDFWQNVICACLSLRIVGHEEDKLRVDDSGSISFQSLPRTFLSFPSLLCSFYSAVGIEHITHFPRYISQKTPLCDNGLFYRGWKHTNVWPD